MKELGDIRPVEGARPALEEDVILTPRRDFIRETRLRRVPSIALVRGGTPVSAGHEKQQALRVRVNRQQAIRA